jgi:hypothetical protein
MKLVKFAGYDLNQNDGEHSTPVTARSGLVSLPNGAFDQDGTRLYMEPGRISYRALINAQQESVDGAIDSFLSVLARGRGVMTGELISGKQRVTYAKMLNFQRTMSAATWGCNQPLQVTFEQDFPFWFAEEDGEYFDNGLKFDTAGLKFDGHYDEFDINSASISFGIDNNGGVRNHAGEITIVGGSISNFTLFNDTNGLSFTFTGNILAGDNLVVNCLSRQVTVDGDNYYRYINLGSEKQTEIMALEPGVNSFRLVCGTYTSPAKLSFRWKRMYL